MARLTGAIEQVPSTVSAIKVDGRRAYALAREGATVELKARPVTVHRFDVLASRPGSDDGVPVLDLDVEVHCTTGTYVRALARDLGADLGVGGHLTRLRRTTVGPVGLDGAADLEAQLLADGVAFRPGPRERIAPDILSALREAILAGVMISADHRARASGRLSRGTSMGPMAPLAGDRKAREAPKTAAMAKIGHST